MRLSKFLLKLFGWSVSVSAPDYPKSIICVAPHTSNWDFVLCELAITSVDMKAIKKFYVPYQGKYPDKFTTE